MEKSWKAAITRVLREADSPLHYSDISERILSEGYYQTEGATPARGRYACGYRECPAGAFHQAPR